MTIFHTAASVVRIPGFFATLPYHGRALQVHDKSEQDRKRGTDSNSTEGQQDPRRKPIEEPALEISLPEDERVCSGNSVVARGGEQGGVDVKEGDGFNSGEDGKGGSDASGKTKDAGRTAADGRGSGWGDAETWALATEEVSKIERYKHDGRFVLCFFKDRWLEGSLYKM